MILGIDPGSRVTGFGLIKSDGDKVIYFNQALHGRSGYTLSLTNTSDPRKTMYFPKFPWFKVDNPYLEFPICVLN